MLKLVALAFHSRWRIFKIPIISKVIANFTPFEKKYIAFMFKSFFANTAAIINARIFVFTPLERGIFFSYRNHFK
jgi:hypothetical protein